MDCLVKCLAFQIMRRCQAPSQVAKRYGLEPDTPSPSSPVTPVTSRTRKRVKYTEDDEDSGMDTSSPLRSPLSLVTNAQRAPMIGTCSPVSSSILSPHEALIRYFLSIIKRYVITVLIIFEWGMRVTYWVIKWGSISHLSVRNHFGQAITLKMVMKSKPTKSWLSFLNKILVHYWFIFTLGPY